MTAHKDGKAIMKSNLDEILTAMGWAGRRLDDMHAVEAGAGNISVCTAADLDLASRFPNEDSIQLPWTVPDLVGHTLLVTGSGCRLRDVAENPEGNVSAVVVNNGGTTGRWFTSPKKIFARPTSEFNSHLAVHHDQIQRRGIDFHVTIHAQPPYLVSLSHIKELRNDKDFNRCLMRWEPETIVQVPEGVKVLDFMVPGSEELMQNNVSGLREHQITIWSKHGIMVRSDSSPVAAVDKVEYIEAGAMYEHRNQSSGGLGEGLTDAELHRVVQAFDVSTNLF